MYKKIGLIIILVTTTFVNINTTTLAAEKALVLTIADLTWASMIPNEKVEYALARATKNYQADFFMNDKNSKVYTAGSPGNGVWMLNAKYDSKNRLIGVEYLHYKDKYQAINIVTKGIKIGSGVAEVYKNLGQNAKVSKWEFTGESDDEWKYTDLKYLIQVKETKQTGYLTITVRHTDNQKDNESKVSSISYTINPLSTQSESNPKSNPSTVGNLQGSLADPENMPLTTSSAIYKGVTIKRGMTKQQVRKVLGIPNEIKTPMRGDAQSIAALKAMYGVNKYNWMDIEQWSYVDYSEVIAVFFNHEGTVGSVYYQKL